MEQLSPIGPVYQAGTLSGNPLAMNAGLAVLREILRQGPGLYARLEELGQRLEYGLQRQFSDAGVKCAIQRKGSILTPFFTGTAVGNYADAKRCDTASFGRFFHALLDGGIYVAPSQYEGWFLSTAHTEDMIDQTVEMVGKALKRSQHAGNTIATFLTATAPE
jgi:glutamate-1-semialdehyde 2,1-aminomutase